MLDKSVAANRLGTEPVGKLLLKFSIPAITGMLTSALYNVVDRIFIGNFVNEIALGGISLVLPLMTIAIAFAMLFGIGAANMISLRLGQGKKQEAQNAMNHCFFLLIGAGLVLMTAGIFFLEPLLFIMGAVEGSEALGYAKDYMRITLFGSVFFMVSFGLSHCTRAQGFPGITMIAMMLGAILNIIFDAIFIVWFEWGVKGAGWATVISQFISAAYILRFALSGKAVVSLNLKFFKPKPAVILQIMALGSAQALLQFLISIVQVLHNKSAAWYGETSLGTASGGDIALSGMNIAGAVLMLILMPVFGINQGAQPLIGYNYGAKLYKRVLRAYISAITAATLVCLLGFFMVQIFSVQLVRMFTIEGSETLMQFAPRALRTIMLLLPLSGFQIVSTTFFVVTGRPKMSIFLSMLRQGVVLIPCIIIFGRVWGLWGVIAATPVADGIAFAVTAVLIFIELKKLRKESVLK
ncbi:MAG: MATE family efflux transporter [Treponema sp.]|nr:MATE family efflux transporter [Treponema sp.]